MDQEHRPPSPLDNPHAGINIDISSTCLWVMAKRLRDVCG
jgi:hypothetical protein